MSTYSERSDAEKKAEKKAYAKRKAQNKAYREMKKLMNAKLKEIRLMLELKAAQTPKPKRRRPKWLKPSERPIASLKECRRHKWFKEEVRVDSE